MNSRRAIDALRRRVTIALWCDAVFAEALVAVALVFGVVVLIARLLFGVGLNSSPSWFALLAALPIWALAVVARRRPSAVAIAAHVDRRLGLGGLLLARDETADSTWDATLEARVAGAAAEALPQLEPKRWLTRSALAVLFVVCVALLPPPETPVQVQRQPLIAAELEELADDLELALEEGTLSEEQGVELERRLQELRERAADGEQVEWSDVDSLGEQLAWEEETRRSGLQAVRDSASELATAAESSHDEMTAAEAARLGELLEQSRDLGLLEPLSVELREALEALDGQQLTQGQALDAAQLAALTPEQLAQLAAALEGAAATELAELANATRLGEGELADLEAVLAAAGAGAAAGGDTPGASAPGRGGVDRGPGAATLEWTHELAIDGSVVEQTERLPPGIAVPREWEVLGVGRAAPDVDPQRAPAGSGSPVGPGRAGQGGEATFNRRVAPRHRDVVRRFFSEGKR